MGSNAHLPEICIQAPFDRVVLRAVAVTRQRGSSQAAAVGITDGVRVADALSDQGIASWAQQSLLSSSCMRGIIIIIVSPYTNSESACNRNEVCHGECSKIQ